MSAQSTVKAPPLHHAALSFLKRDGCAPAAWAPPSELRQTWEEMSGATKKTGTVHRSTGVPAGGAENMLTCCDPALFQTNACLS